MSNDGIPRDKDEDLPASTDPAGARVADGLASLAGGWEGSEELVQLIEESRRRGVRVSGAPPA